MYSRDVLHLLSLFKPSLNLLFFLLCPRSECLRISLARLRDHCLPVFVTRTLTDRMSVLGEGCLGYDVGPVFQRSNNPAQSAAVFGSRKNKRSCTSGTARRISN
jgi:hypothetical protein